MKSCHSSIAGLRIGTWSGLLLGSLFLDVATAAGDEPAFNRDIRPILADKCFKCHGPDEKQRQGDLRLDEEQATLADLNGHRAIVRHKPDESELIRRITATDPDERMPPADSGKTLTPREIDLLREWIQAGAAWQGHWSLLPPSRPAVPAVAAGDRELPSPIDRFIQARLAADGQRLAPRADSRTLIRRLSFDLRGLPPSVADVDAFVRDPSESAYEALVDRFLASEHFGERMAISWLDLVRYADSIGYHSDNPREVSLYRDYVILAFNQNLRFDQFTVENLAGDLLPNRTEWQWIASGYNRLLQTTEEGGAQPREYAAKYAADRVRNVSSVWLGVTVGCAECHDHKYDPFTMKDFYSLAAFFADIDELPVGRRQQTPIPNPEQAAQLQELEQRIAEVSLRLDTQTPELDAALARWEAAIGDAKLGTWHVLGPFAAETFDLAHDTDFGTEQQVDLAQTLQANGELKWTPKPDWKDGQVQELAGGAGASATYLFRSITVEAATRIKLALGSDDGLRVWVNGETVLDQRVRRAAAADQEQLELALTPGENRLLLKVSNADGPTGFYFRLLNADVPENIRTIVRVGAGDRTEPQRGELAKYFRSVAPELAAARQERETLEKSKQALLDVVPTMLVSVTKPPTEMRILPRGNWLDDSGPMVEPNTPECLPGLRVEGERPNRLDLARWLCRPDHPLTSRVFVNRLWKLLLGYGLVRSLEDFGTQGELPTHPDLLDWLASDFVLGGWDVKRTIKEIVMCETYRQSSYATTEMRRVDPYNRLLARQTSWRLDAELVRDNALSISGLLVPTVGGASVKPYQPAGYWAHLNFPVREWTNDSGDKIYRRGLYTHWQRTFPHPSLIAFDAPSREECTAERPRSNTPQQALVLLNDPTYVEAARVFAERIIRSGAAREERIQWAFREALSRSATEQEVAILGEMVDKHRSQYQAEPNAAVALLGVGDRAAAQDLGADEIAAWTSVARVILNLHETITRS